MSQGEWQIGAMPDGQFIVVRVLPETLIGPFPDLISAECALDELQSAECKRIVQ